MKEYPLYDKHHLCPSARYVGGVSRYVCKCPSPNECPGVQAVQPDDEGFSELALAFALWPRTWQPPRPLASRRERATKLFKEEIKCQRTSTPGPWHANCAANDEHNENGVRVREPVNGHIIATVLGGANARLVAAAPDLLAACVKACTYMEEDVNHFGWLENEITKQLQAAIDAAEGESNA